MTLLKVRRLTKNKDEDLYNNLNKEIKNCAEAKENWFEEKCHEIENLKDCSSRKMFYHIREKFKSFTQMHPLLEWQAQNKPDRYFKSLR